MTPGFSQGKSQVGACRGEVTGKGGAEDQGMLRREQQEAAVSRGLGSRVSFGQYLGGMAGRPVDPVLIPRAVPARVLAELDGMAFKE